jgi:hypothetical protein
MKQNDTIIRKMMQFIPMDTFKTLLIECFRGIFPINKFFPIGHLFLYGPNEYNEECFGHSEDRPGLTDFELGRDSVWYETIIETGFLCYFILCEYLEIEGFEPIHMQLIDDANMKRAAMAKKHGFFGKLRALIWLLLKG